MQLAAGSRLGPYEIVSPIGAGGMGEVYRARDTRLDRIVAIKVLHSAVVSAPDLKARFDREARTISQLNHPNICALYDVGHQDGIDYLVMEYLEGETLADRIRRGPLGLQDLVRIGSEIAAGLDAAHRAGVVHRDLKPANVMLAKTGTKLLDFGLAKAAALAAGAAAAPLLSAAVTMENASPLTSQGVVVGTIQYMSPQQIEGKEADSRSDIFSFGSVLYEMATGKPAFGGKSQLSVASAILEKEPEPLSAFSPASPAALDYVIRTCLAKNPDDRYQSAADIRLQLRWVTQNIAPATTAPPRANRSWFVFAIALLMAVSACAGWLWWRTSTVRTEPLHVTIPVEAGTAAGTFNSPVIISPDGRLLVYTVRRDGRQQLYLRRLNESEGRILAGSDGATGPFFSPDSQWIAFGVNLTLKKLSVAGGSPIDICNISGSDDELGFLGGTWSPDGRIIFIPGFNIGLFEVSANGGTAKPLLTTDVAKNRIALTHPQILPEGKGVLFTVVPGTARTSDDEQIAVLEPGATEPRILVQGGSHGRYLASGQLIYGRGGTLFAVRFNLSNMAVVGTPAPLVTSVQEAPPDVLYSLSDNGTLVYAPAIKANNARLFIVDRQGDRRAITDGSLGPVDLAVSPDGKKVVARVPAANDDLWTFDVSRGTALRLTFEPGDEIYPQWTPDGSRIAYGMRTGRIYWRASDGSGQREELSHGDSPQYPSSFSPDGKWLAIVERTATRHRDISIIPVGAGERKAVPFANTDADEWSPKFSPDGRFIAYVSDESGSNEIYIRPFGSSGGRRRITSNGGQLPLWNPTGRELFFINGTALMGVGIDADGNANTAERPIVDINAMGYQLSSEVPVYDVMPDGQHFVMALSPPSANPTHYELVVNWFEELKRLTAH